MSITTPRVTMGGTLDRSSVLNPRAVLSSAPLPVSAFCTRPVIEPVAAGIKVHHLNTPRDAVDLTADPWTAIAFLFHDHDWETALIARALAGRAFYVGAMGSRAAQANRAASLVAAGVSPEDIARLRAPIGLIPSSRDPQVLALSTLAEIVRDFERTTAREDIVLELTT
eukprot:gene31413-41886_t